MILNRSDQKQRCEEKKKKNHYHHHPLPPASRCRLSYHANEKKGDKRALRAKPVALVWPNPADSIAIIVRFMAADRTANRTSN